MKNALLLLCTWLVCGTACKKSSSIAIKSATGYLHYENPAADGRGYWYTVNDTQLILLSDDFKKGQYQQYIEVNTTIEYEDNGKKGCRPNGLAGGCSGQYPLVHVLGFKKL